MGLIYCGNENQIPYYIREADINIYSLQELAYFIKKYSMLISNNFINKNLIMYIKNQLNNQNLYYELNTLYNNKDSDIVNMLILILNYCGMYDENDINDFIEYINYLQKIDKDEYIKLCADSLYTLKKYHKAILQYQKIPDNAYTYKNIGYAYAKLLDFDKAIKYLDIAFAKEKNIDILKDIYICCKLSKRIEKFDKYRELVSDERVADWEYEIVKLKLNAKNSKNIEMIDDIFMMGDNYIKEHLSLRINNIKEKYRYV